MVFTFFFLKLWRKQGELAESVVLREGRRATPSCYIHFSFTFVWIKWIYTFFFPLARRMSRVFFCFVSEGMTDPAAVHSLAAVENET